MNEKLRNQVLEGMIKAAQDPLNRELEGLECAVYKLFDRLNYYVSKDEERHPQGYRYIQMRPGYLVEAFRFVEEHLRSGKRKYSDNQFLDVGCGLGNVGLFARVMSSVYSFDGIEYQESLATHDVTKAIFGEVYNVDALEFEDYGRYDVIYFYCPAQDVPFQRKLEKLICEQMKKGAILIAGFKQSDLFKYMKPLKGGEFGDIQVYEKSQT